LRLRFVVFCFYEPHTEKRGVRYPLPDVNGVKLLSAIREQYPAI
jgi:hypothetical protein